MNRHGNFQRVAGAVLAAGLLVAGVSYSGVAVAGEPVSTSSIVDRSDVGVTLTCYRWNTKGSPDYTYDKDASVRLQAKSCKASDGSPRAYVRARVCNHRASGKRYVNASLRRDKAENIIYSSGVVSWPAVGSCRNFKAVRAWKGHTYWAAMTLSYTNGGSRSESTYPTRWHYG